MQISSGGSPAKQISDCSGKKKPAPDEAVEVLSGNSVNRVRGIGLDRGIVGWCTAKRSSMKVLKRYANRRLYDAGTSKTVTLDDVARYIREGEEVRVVDNATGEDITVRVLGQTFLRITTEERSAEFGSFLLSSLIREVSQNLSGFLMRLIQGGIGTAWLTPEKLEKIVEDLVQRGELEIGEKPDFVNLLQAQLSQHGEQLKQRAKEAVSQLSDLENPGLEELSGRLEEVARLIKKIGR